jgi:hypothetical protein
MPLDFPTNPVNGQTYASYVYNSAVGAWQSTEDSATVAVTGPTAPASANNGDIWYNTNTGVSYIYYSDGTSSQWVEIISSAVPALNTKADLSGATFTGNVTAPRFISTQATGTAPLTITSTTAVTNLNADLLDGQHASAFAASSHTHLSQNVESYLTSSSGATQSLFWTKICTVTLTGRYANQAMTLEFTGDGPGDQFTYSARLRFRVKQQEEFGTNPRTELVMEHGYPGNSVQKTRFVAVIIQNTPSTVVELYAQLPVSYFNWRYSATSHTTNPTNTVFHQNSGNIASLPAGTQVACIEDTRSLYGNIAASGITSGSLAVANGGTGATTLTSGAYLKGAGTGAITSQVGIPKSDIPTPVAATSRYTAGGIMSTSYGTFVTVTITSNGRPTVINMSGTYTNANSGANRIVDFRVQMDGVTVGQELVGLYSPLVSGGGSPLTAADTFLITPTAGSRTFTLQAKANNVSSVGLNRASLTVYEL